MGAVDVQLDAAKFLDKVFSKKKDTSVEEKIEALQNSRAIKRLEIRMETYEAKWEKQKNDVTEKVDKYTEEQYKL